MSKFAMVALYAIGIFLVFASAVGLIGVLLGDFAFRDVVQFFTAGALFSGLAAIIELLRKISRQAEG